ncbi:uncharacterized protein cubi_02324 [Cryptosporidium ubiquitum]|uniref:Uncharacterized protein n=1 Tax=Cryptosporidium ubiquitum TaxID=857276 RepID=A0A1J4MJR8_9CRYT|nr:uncharacterized protein cubi_02324 [Cryptosporidium ubiquitum]OII73093.1 hypothetical protein cubi_02324 [Cryptosporidium ubiquitum]
MNFRDYLILLPRIIFIFVIPWLSLIIKTNSLPWIPEYEFNDQLKVLERIQKNGLQSLVEKKLLSKYEVKFTEQHEKLRNLINNTKEQIYFNQVNQMYDLLADQIRNIGFSCPTTSAIKNRYCNEKKLKGFENGRERSYCESGFDPSPIAYSYQSSEYSYSDSGDILLNYENEDLILDDTNCISVIVDGDVLICGDLVVANGQLNTLTSFDAFEAQNLSVGKMQSMHAKRRCIIRRGLTVRGSMILPFSNLIVIGKLIVGKNVYTADLQVDLSSNLFIGVLYLFSDLYQSKNDSDTWNPFSITRIKLLHVSNSCSNEFNNTIIYNRPQDNSKFNESGEIDQNMGSLWSSRKIYVGNSGKLWVRGDIHAGEIVISDAGLVFDTCGNLKTNTTHGLGIYIRDSGSLHMMSSSIFTSRLSVIRSSVVIIKKGELNVNSILLLHSGSKIRIGGNIILHIASIRESSTLYADSLEILNQDIENIEHYRKKKNNSNIFSHNNTQYIGTNSIDKLAGYLQVVSASTVTIYGGIFVQGSIEINDGSELFSMGKIRILENVIINDGSEILILGDFNYSNNYDWNGICEGYAHCILGSVLVSNSSNMFIANGSLKVNEYVDLIEGNFILGENMEVGKSFISTKKSNFFISEGDLIINNADLSLETNILEKKSFLISNGVFLINGKLLVRNGDVALITKSYLKVQQIYINQGSLGMSTKSLTVVNGGKINKLMDLFLFENKIPLNILINGNLTIDTFSEMFVLEGSISIESIILTSNSKINIEKKMNSGVDLYQISIHKVVVLQGNSFMNIPEGYLLEVNSGIMVDEFSIMNCDQSIIEGDLFIDDGGFFIAKSVIIFYPSTLVSQDSSKIYIENLQVYYNTKENTLSQSSENSNIPLFISENGGSIKIHQCEYNCERSKCVKLLFGIRTVESIITIEKSHPWFIPVKASVQFFDLNSTSSKELYEVIDPIAFIVRKNPEEKKQIEVKPRITFSKGEQVRRGRTWEIDRNTFNLFNESQPIQWH